MSHFFPLLCALFLIATSCTKSTLPENSFLVDFERSEIGKLTDRDTKNIWGNASLLCGKKDFLFYKFGITPHPHFISEENNNRFLKVLVPGSHFGPITGAQWKFPVSPADEYYFSFRVKFENDFDFVKGGKLPGLAGGKANSGGNIPDGHDGWSARMMFWEGGKLSFYVYSPAQSSQWGERLYWKESSGDTVRIGQGSWHLITQRVRMNTPGKADGVLQGWFDGQEAFYNDSILFRKDEKLKIDQVFYSVFMGGGDQSWAPVKDEYICFDDFRISTQPFNH